MHKDKRNWWIGGLVMAAVVALALALPTASAAEGEDPGAKANHYKCYQVLDWGQFEPKKIELKDQFGGSVARTMEPHSLCNPVDKNGEGIVDQDSHLVCYTIQDDPQGNTPRVKEVMIKNQFEQGPMWVGSATQICVPSLKKYEPRG